MSLFVIKMIALFSMTADHLGTFLFPGDIYLRLIGRLSFPLFAWAIANGARFTKNINKYLLRVFILAIISQIPYQVLFTAYGVDKPGLNILFTLALGLLGIIFLKIFNKFLVRVLIIFLLSLFSVLVKSDYGFFGVLTIIIFYLYYESPIKFSIFYSLLVAVFYIIPIAVNKYLNGVLNISIVNILEIFSPASLLIIASYNKKLGCDIKYLFYLFYPVHLILIYLITVYLFKI